MANLVNPETKKIVSTVSLESVNLTPDLTQAMSSYATQMQMAQIAEQIQLVQIAVEIVAFPSSIRVCAFPSHTSVP